jgi:hypothetical protein
MIKPRRMRWVLHAGCMRERERERRYAYRVSVGKLERKKLHGRPRCRWEENIKMSLKVIG